MRTATKAGSAATIAVALLLPFTAGMSQGEVTRKGSLQVSFEGKIRPKNLPRHTRAPISVSLAGDIKATDGGIPPQLRTIFLQINRQGRIDARGLPTCRLEQIQPATTDEALRNCAPSLVGEGRFRASVSLPDSSPFPSNGRVLAFNGRKEGRRAILAHIYGRQPLPTSHVLAFVLRRAKKGRYATTLTAHLPRIAAEWGYVSGLSLTLKRSFRARGRAHSYLAADCPAPTGFRGAAFPFARVSFGFEDGQVLTSTLTRWCGVRTMP